MNCLVSTLEIKGEKPKKQTPPPKKKRNPQTKTSANWQTLIQFINLIKIKGQLISCVAIFLWLCSFFMINHSLNYCPKNKYGKYEDEVKNLISIYWLEAMVVSLASKMKQ